MSTALLPDSAPFSEEQRAWLSGFFAGMLSAEGEATGTYSEPSETIQEEEEFPWHDPALELSERMDMADGKPIERRLMAAMAQLDCGACGYVCQTYSEAIASGSEKNLSLCSPGGRDTSRMLKQLVKEISLPRQTISAPAASAAAVESPPGYSRNAPLPAQLVASRPLNGQGSSKDTRHVVIDLGQTALKYDVGDALGVYPLNCPQLVNDVVDWLDMTEPAERLSIAERLRKTYCLKTVTEELAEQLLQALPDIAARDTLAKHLSDEEYYEQHDVLDLLRLFPSGSLSGDELLEFLQPLAPRLYSIASSQRMHPGQVHLTVGKVSWQAGDRLRKGVASTMLAERLGEGDEVQVFVQPSHGFRLPEDPSTPMIMVGPGTGIAPFIAFLQDRQALQAEGRNWLFFGDQHAHTDYLYRDQLTSWLSDGLLTRLDVAFSRDQEEKIYVQHRMLEQAAEIWSWLQAGAHFYVCGDASRMAKDVDAALCTIVQQEGKLSASEAQQFIKTLSQTDRYCRDVY